jgi:hypothetical protein
MEKKRILLHACARPSLLLTFKTPRCHSDDWMKSNGFTDDASEKVEEQKKLQWGGGKIKDLNLPAAVSVPAGVEYLPFFWV